MEVNSLVITLNFWMGENYSLTSAMDCKGVIMISMENNYGHYKYLCLHYISCAIIQMYSIALMINTEILIPLVLARNYCAFNHSYIYIVNFIGFFTVLI